MTLIVVGIALIALVLTLVRGKDVCTECGTELPSKTKRSLQVRTGQRCALCAMSARMDPAGEVS